MSLTKAYPRMMEADFLSVKDFGAVGDGTTDDLAAFNSAIAAGIAQKKAIILPAGTYRLSATLNVSGCSMLGAGYYSTRATLVFDDGVGVGVLCRTNKNICLENFNINMSSQTSDYVGLLVNAVWESAFKAIRITGAGSGDPSVAGFTGFGMVLRPAGPTISTTTESAIIETLQTAYLGYTFGVYYNHLEHIMIGGCSYGLSYIDDISGPSVNQNLCLSGKINGNWNNVWLDGIGGGATFINTCAEGANNNAVTVQNTSGGTNPTWIGGELGASNKKWVGNGFLFSVVAGVDFPVANAAGERATHLRTAQGGGMCIGEKFVGGGGYGLIDGYPSGTAPSDWGDIYKAPQYDSFTHTATTTTFDVLKISGLGQAATSFTLVVTLYDSSSPQGGAVLKYNVSAYDYAGGPGIVIDKVQEQLYGNWTNISGGTVTVGLSDAIVGSEVVYTVSVSYGTSLGDIQAQVNIFDFVNPSSSTLTYFP